MTPGREHELQRRSMMPSLQQHRIDEAVVAEHHDPRIGPHHLAQEQRRYGDDQDSGLDQPIVGQHQRIGKRIAEHEADSRGEKAEPDGVEKDAGIKRLQQRRRNCRA